MRSSWARDGVDPGIVGDDVQLDAVGDGEIGVTAGLLDEADDVAGPSLQLQLGRQVDVEDDDPGAAGQRLAGPLAVGDHRQGELARFEPVATRLDAIALEAPVPGLDRPDDLLGVTPEAGPDRGRQHLQHLAGDRRDVVGERDVAHVDLVGDDLDERGQLAGVGDGHGEAGQRLTDPPPVGLAHRQRRRADVADVVHRRHQLVVGRHLARRRPVAEVHAAGDVAAPAVQAAVDLLGDERQQRRGHAHHHVEHGVQCVDGVGIAVPEALPAAADVPVGQRVEERPDAGARPEQVVGVHRRRHLLDETMRLGEDVAVEHVVRGVRPDDALVTGDVGVEREEVPRVPQRQQHLADGVAQPAGGDREVAAAQDRRRQQVPAHRVGAVAVEHLHRVRVVAQALRHLQPVVAEDDAVAHARLGTPGGRTAPSPARAACRTSRASGRCTRR